ncbi:dihydrofolate reductase family protein [Tsukamurella sp. 8F]|uniref:dihydrofolate reductase family protein n=1 Tax=unclassified Tsukamurella TaxID=2633480 RepID=UPI0023BA2251|nr:MULTISPECIES: dihydrofolate reductase family protein [unclassified Tsukamurella]MDF0531415.1 dihydrofolate reductase family protein [Tsukamurella sp. 8J]MDF0585279.1 dihydrofolate reductase family protein [Tsukamurella sp. 8F]
MPTVEPHTTQTIEPLGDDRRLAELYAHPAPEGRAYVRSNFVASLDGSIQVPDSRGHLTSGDLGGDGDHRVFAALRAAADVVLVGAGTVRAEDYETPDRPAMAIVTAGGLRPTPRLFPHDGPRPLVYAPEGADTAALADAGAVVVAAGDGRVDLALVLADLYGRDLGRVLAEGGPGLLGQLVAESRLDDYCLTIAPRLVGGDGKRPTDGPFAPDGTWARAHLLADDEGYLYGRWLAPRRA